MSDWNIQDTPEIESIIYTGCWNILILPCLASTENQLEKIDVHLVIQIL